MPRTVGAGNKGGNVCERYWVAQGNEPRKIAAGSPLYKTLMRKIDNERKQRAIDEKFAAREREPADKSWLRSHERAFYSKEPMWANRARQVTLDGSFLDSGRSVKDPIRIDVDDAPPTPALTAHATPTAAAGTSALTPVVVEEDITTIPPLTRRIQGTEPPKKKPKTVRASKCRSKAVMCNCVVDGSRVGAKVVQRNGRLFYCCGYAQQNGMGWDKGLHSAKCCYDLGDAPLYEKHQTQIINLDAT